MKFFNSKQTKWKVYSAVGTVFLLALASAILPLTAANAQKQPRVLKTEEKGGVYQPQQREVRVHDPVNFTDAARQTELTQVQPLPWLDAIPAPKGTPPVKQSRVPVPPASELQVAPTPSVTGTSPGPIKTFKGEFLSGTTIPPDTMGAVGLNHVITVSNNNMSIQDRNGAVLSRASISSFWSGVILEGGVAASAFDPKVLFDRFNSRWILIASANANLPSSAVLFAVSATSDPTGTWYRLSVDADSAATTTAGLWIDYPSIGFNKNWIVINENVFGYGTGNTGYKRSDVYVIDKQAAYTNTLSTVNAFRDLSSNCVAPFETKLGCGFTMAPTIVEDNTSNDMYLVEDWDSTAGQLRLSKISGTPGAPMLTVGTQFPQSTNSWRFAAPRVGTTGGYAAQRQQSLHAVSGTRVMTNDSRIQNAVLRNGSLWTTHTVMVAATPTLAGTTVGGTTNPDIRSAIQWWKIDPTVETGAAVPALQRGRIEDPTADNCHDGNSGTRTTGGCTSTAAQTGAFFAYPSISVNRNDDVLVGFTQLSALTYPSGAYAIRRSTDAPNTMRDVVVFRPGQANYNLGSGTSGTTARQNRWGDYSASQTDPINDTDFWTVQEYGGTVRDFGIGLAGNWETWWAQVRPSAAAPVSSGNLVISEFRLRGPQGPRDEFVELYNPNATPVIVGTADNSEGWALAYSANGSTVTTVAVIPNGTVIPPKGHFLIADNPDSASGPTVTYGLNAYAGNGVRGADSDTGWSFDLADNGGLAIFKTANAANFNTTTRMDSVGFSSIAAGLFKEGNGIPAISTATPTGQISFVRNSSAGDAQDTGANENDFVFVSSAATTEALGGTPTLGAPQPENLSSPVLSNPQLPVTLVDGNASAANAPNQVYDPTPVTNGANGTVSVRRSVVNNTGGNVTRLRFRMTSLSTFPNALDLRLLSSPDISVTTSDATVCGAQPAPCSVAVKALTLEEPPAQPNGGGVNSSVFAGSVTLAAPLAPNARLNVNFLFGVASGTPFSKATPEAAVPFTVNAEAFVQPALAPTAAAVAVGGRVSSGDGSGIRSALVQMTRPDGTTVSTRTNSFGYYRFEGLRAGETYVFSVNVKGYEFASRVVQVQDEIADLDFIAGSK